MSERAASNIRQLLRDVANGRMSIDDALDCLPCADDLYFNDTIDVGPEARLDPDRAHRSGVPEVVFGEGKTPEHVSALLRCLAERNGKALATRVSLEASGLSRVALGDTYDVDCCDEARTIVVTSRELPAGCNGRTVGILCAGTTDRPVAEEARVTAEFMGCRVIAAHDVGVAGIHRLFPPLKTMRDQNVDALVVVAGMEGALPTVVKSLIPVPVIGVPASTGYGYGGKGQAALMTMLQSCSPGLVVVNIDNGFGAGAAAALMASRAHRAHRADAEAMTGGRDGEHE